MKRDAYSKDADQARVLAEYGDGPGERAAGRTIKRLVARCRKLEREIDALRTSVDRKTWQDLVRERDAADLRALKAREEEQRLRDRLTRAGLSDKEE